MDVPKKDSRASYTEGNPVQPKNMKKGSQKMVNPPNTFQYDQSDSDLNKRGASSEEGAKWFKKLGLKVPSGQSGDYK